MGKTPISVSGCLGVEKKDVAGGGGQNKPPVVVKYLG
jgi:hypothetical protein